MKEKKQLKRNESETPCWAAAEVPVDGYVNKLASNEDLYVFITNEIENDGTCTGLMWDLFCILVVL